MKLHDSVVGWVSSILEQERARWPELLAGLEERLGAAWSLRRLAQPQTYSLGASLRDGRELPLADWFEELGRAGMAGMLPGAWCRAPHPRSATGAPRAFRAHAGGPGA